MRKAGFWSLLLAVFLAACKPQAALTPEQAVHHKLLQRPGIVANSIQVQPAERLQGQYFILAAYHIFSQGEGELSCMTLFEVGRLDGNWEISGHGTGCSQNLFLGVFDTQFGYANNYANRAEEFSYAAVETMITDAVWVDVTWDDGAIQRAPVIDDYFLAVRDGAYRPQLFVVLDRDEKETYTYKVEP